HRSCLAIRQLQPSSLSELGVTGSQLDTRSMAWLGWQSVRSRTLAVALIALMFLGGTGSWHLDADDPDFGASPAAHDHSSHHEAFRTPATDDAPSHCAICHWLQLFRASAMRQARVQFAAAS